MKKVAIILHNYGNPGQPFITEWFLRLVNNQHDIIIKGFTDSPYSKNLPGSVTVCKRSGFAKIRFCFIKWLLNLFGAKLNVPAFLVPIARFRPDVVHLLNAQQIDYYQPVFQFLHAPLIVSFRGYETNVRPTHDKEWMKRLQLLYTQASGLHFVSDFLKEQAIVLGAKKEKCVVIRRTVDTDFFKPSSLPKGRSDYVKLLAVGRLVWQKGYPDLLKALAEVKHCGYKFMLTIIGKGIDYESICELILSLDLNDSVIIVPPVDRMKLLEYYQEADIFLQSSVSEALPNAVLEACACGLPVLASRVGGIPEAIKHEYSGLLFKAGDSRDLANNLLRLLNDYQLREHLGKCARAQMEGGFGVDKEYKNWNFYYKSMVR